MGAGCSSRGVGLLHPPPNGPWDTFPFKKDVKVCVDNVTYFLHSQVLAVWSSYFSDHLPSKFPCELRLVGLPGGAESFEVIARYFYREAVGLSHDNALELLGATRYLKVRDQALGEEMNLSAVFLGYIESHMLNDWRNCLDILISRYNNDTLTGIDDVLERSEENITNYGKTLGKSTSIEEVQAFFIQLEKTPRFLLHKLLTRFKDAELNFIEVGNLITLGDENWLYCNFQARRFSTVDLKQAEESFISILEFLVNSIPVDSYGMSKPPLPSASYLFALMDACCQRHRFLPSSIFKKLLTLIRHEYMKKGPGLQPCIEKENEMLNGFGDRLEAFESPLSIEVHNSSLSWYEMREGQDEERVKTMRAFDQSVCAILAASDGTVWTGGFAPDIKVWKNCQCIAILQGHMSHINAIVEGASGSIWSASADKTIKHWQGRRCTSTLEAHTSCVASLLCTSDGQLWSGGACGDCCIKLWRRDSCVFTLTGHTDSVLSLAVSPNGCLVSGSRDKTMRLWHNGLCLSVVPLDMCIFQISFFQNGFVWLNVVDYYCNKGEVIKFKLGNLLATDVEISLRNSKSVRTSRKSFRGSASPFSASFSSFLSSDWFSSDAILIAQDVNVNGLVVQNSFVGMHDCAWICQKNKIIVVKDDVCVFTFSDHSHDVCCITMKSDGALCSGDSGGVWKQWQSELT